MMYIFVICTHLYLAILIYNCVLILYYFALIILDSFYIQ